MKRIKNFWRLLQINSILARYRIDTIVFQHRYFYSLRFLSLFNPWNWWPTTSRSRGETIRLALETLGPVFIKFGQMLSTRRDLLPADIADELAKLQDQVPPFSGELTKQILEKAYQQPINQLFQHFEIIPLASASIAQVHAAELLNGKQVVIKILRPNIKKLIQQDIAVMYLLAKITGKFWKKSRRFKARDLVAEFEASILGELDLQREAANASQLRRHFLGAKELYIPEIFWDYTHHHVLVMERIHGIPIRDKQQLQSHQVNLKKLAERGVEIFFTQVFRDSFFHADMHPGNIFVSYQNPQDPQYIAVDFGIMGTLNPTDQRYIAENFLAFFKRDYRRVAILHVESGWAPPHTRIDQLETAIRTVCEPIFERPLAEISFGQLLLRLFQMAADFNIEIQPQLILLQKTLLNIEGLGRELYPQLDLWQTAKPFLERWIKKQVGPRAFLRKIKQYAPLWLEQLPEWPQLIYTSLQHLNNTSATKQQHTAVKANKPYNMLSGFLLGFLSAALMASIVYIYLYR